jgi:hypothetical protein
MYKVMKRGGCGMVLSLNELKEFWKIGSSASGLSSTAILRVIVEKKETETSK